MLATVFFASFTSFVHLQPGITDSLVHDWRRVRVKHLWLGKGGIIPDLCGNLCPFTADLFPVWFTQSSNQPLLPVVVEVVVSHLCFGWSLILCHSDWRAALVLPAGWFGYTEDVTDGGAVPPVQLPANIFPNYGEVEEDDPYRYYQPNYPAPRPVAPDDPALSPDGTDAYRGVRSVEGARGG